MFPFDGVIMCDVANTWHSIMDIVGGLGSHLLKWIINKSSQAQ